MSELPPAGVPGQRVRLVRCEDPFTLLEPGTEGEVTHIDGLGTVHVKWADGHTLGLVPGVDVWEVIG